MKYFLQISVFLTKLFKRNICINIYLLYFYFRFLYILFVILSPHDHSTAEWSNATHRNHGLNFVSTLPEYGPVGFREDENMKSLRRRRQRRQRQTTNKLWSEKLTFAFGWNKQTTNKTKLKTKLKHMHSFYLYPLIVLSYISKENRLDSVALY